MGDYDYVDPKVDKFMQKVKPWVETFFADMVRNHGYEQGKNRFFLAIFFILAYLGEEIIFSKERCQH